MIIQYIVTLSDHQIPQIYDMPQSIPYPARATTPHGEPLHAPGRVEILA